MGATNGSTRSAFLLAASLGAIEPGLPMSCFGPEPEPVRHGSTKYDRVVSRKGEARQRPRRKAGSHNRRRSR